MPTAFNQVPDWTSWKNDGGGVAAADLDHDGNPELIALRVDRPTPGPNRACYRGGRRLEAAGNVAGGWGPWIEIPNLGRLSWRPVLLPRVRRDGGAVPDDGYARSGDDHLRCARHDAADYGGGTTAIRL
jgi:hypothetical protein